MNSKSREYLKLNKNLLVSFSASITLSAIAAQLLAQQDDYLNTTYTLLVDYAVYFTVFSGLFYADNRKKYRLDSGGVDRPRLKRDLVKIVTSFGVGEVVYTVARWSLQYYFLTIQYDPYLASVTGHAISTGIYMIVINLSVRITRLFRDDG